MHNNEYQLHKVDLYNLNATYNDEHPCFDLNVSNNTMTKHGLHTGPGRFVVN